MEYKQFEVQLKNQAEKIQIILEESQIQKLWEYMQLLLEWNGKINLTAITEPAEIITKHFIDSFTIAKYIKQNSTVIDVGTGAGFPGIPLKIIRPDLKIVLVDALQKRINFLKEIRERLELENIEEIHARIEEIGKNSKYREQFEYVTSRAVANLSTLVEYMLPLCKINGQTICMKGSNVQEELENAKKAIKTLGGKITRVEEFTLPDTDMGRTIIQISKESPTPKQYPRKAGTPSKQPII